MKFIHVEEITEQLLKHPELVNTNYVNLVLRMMAWEIYVAQHDSGVESDIFWLDVARGQISFPLSKISLASSTLITLLAYVILKYDDPQAPWSLHVGKYEYTLNDIDVTIDVPYIQGKPKGDVSSGMMFAGDHPVDQLTIISSLKEEDLDNGDFIMNNSSICVGSDLLRHESLYRSNHTEDSVPLASTKGELMKILHGENLVDDDNVEGVAIVVDELLQPGTDFVMIIPTRNIFLDKVASTKHINRMLMRTILKIKITRGINMIFEQYPPDRCVVPTTTMDI